MSLFDDERYTWRETYFVLFDPARRPLLKDVCRKLESHAGTFRILDRTAESNGTLKSLTLASYEDHSALEISYREGDSVAAEIHALAETLENGCTQQEWERLKKAKTYRAKFDILHFEQTAGTSAFQVVKMPDLSFAPRKPLRGAFPNGRHSDKLTSGTRFHFDPDSYDNCRNDGAGAELDWQDSSSEDSSIIERIDPNTLILVLEVLCRISDGIAIDPASGVVI